MDRLSQDLRHGLRTLMRNPGFTIVAVLILAIGIGANSAIFSVINAVLLEPLPFADPDRLALLWGSKPAQDWPQLPLSQPNFIDIRDQSRSFERMASWTFTRFNLTGQDQPEEVQTGIVNASLFPILGVRPILGREFRPEEDQPGAAPVAILSHSLWQRRFSASREALGKPLILDGRSYQIIGVLPAGFRFASFPKDTEIWIPFGLDPFDGRKYARGSNSLWVIGRLKTGVTMDQAQAELAAISSGLAQKHAEFNKGWSVTAVPLREQVVGSSRTALMVLFGAVGFVMLIACANVANLLLSRGAARQTELAIRAALGASRRRLVGQLLTESVLLSVIGGLMGLLVAVWGVDLLSTLRFSTPSLFVPYVIARDQIALDFRVVAFTLGLSVFTGLLFGLAPALQASRPDLNTALKHSGVRSGSARRGIARHALVVVEVALSMTLLIGAGLMLRSLVKLQSVDPGFRSDNLMTMSVNLSPSRYPEDTQVSAFFDQVVARVGALPGVVSAAAVEYLPLSGMDGSTGFFIDGRPIPTPADNVQTHYRSTTPGYFRTMGVSLLKGREFSDADDARSSRVAIINETMARRFWPGEDPIGRRIALNFEAMRFYRDRPPELDLAKGMREIVGVVADVRHSRLDGDSFAEMYVPHSQKPGREMTLVVRCTGAQEGIASAVRRQVLALDKDQPVSGIGTMQRLLEVSMAQPRYNTLLFGLFGAIALVLASVGVYGVISFSVTQRTREIGIRMALGARRADVLRMVISEGARLALTGVVIGLVAALGLTRVLSGLLFEVSPTDPWTFAGITLLLCSVASVACWLPAHRATKIDPMNALRHE
ncbi:MAG TPA: ABC transporter permease [Patescibacteria group bacterium]|nr:ABC transporter permease [Patescibacteria group bacterium]